MLWIVVAVCLVVAVVAPGIWVKHVLKKYSQPADRYAESGTGAELARHLLDRFELGRVKVEETEVGDHYDPSAEAVRLSAENFSGASLTAVTVAAHEVGHAIQHARRERLFATRQRVVTWAANAGRLSGPLLIAAPVVGALLRTPQISLVVLALAVGSMLLASVAHLVTLPVEFDASFNKALPVLEEGRYLRDEDLPHARRILRAAALTYVAASLMSLLNLGRWLAVLRR